MLDGKVLSLGRAGLSCASDSCGRLPAADSLRGLSTDASGAARVATATPTSADTDLSRPADRAHMSGDDLTTDVESALRSYGVSVESIRDGDPLQLTYMTAFPGREVHHGEIGRALNALIDRADAGEWDPVRVEATVVRAPGDPLGAWRAEPEWFEALAAYEISETEFSTRVLETLSHADEPPGTEERT